MIEQKTSYDLVGSASSAATLTDDYTDNTKTVLSKYLPNINLSGKYTPKAGQTDRVMYIQIEASNDNGTTFYQLATKLEGTDNIKIYVLDSALATGSNQIPITIPGELVSTGGNSYEFSFDFTLQADYIKFSVKEDGQDNFGTANLRVSLSY